MTLLEKVFETNVINLSMVIVILISVAGNALRDSLSHRRKTILLNLEEATKKEAEAREKIRLAKLELSKAQQKAAELEAQNQEQAKREKQKLLEQTAQEIKNLKKKKQEILELAYSQQKKNLISKISKAALDLVRKRCQFDEATGEKIANFYLKLWLSS